jgi:aldehyde dehydrogenase (NAD+)
MSIREIFDHLDYGPAPEATEAAEAWLEARQNRLEHFIDGAWRRPAEEGWFETRSPARGTSLAQVADGTSADVDAAVRAARAAQPAWAGLGGHGRARYLYALARRVQKHSRLLATLESLDNGKPIRESRDIDIPLVARHFYHHAGWAQLMDQELPGYEPLGVAGQIIPWNFPLLMAAWKIAPALAMGNTVVLKPAEFTPVTAVLLAELAQEAGFPPGVFNLVLGDHKAGQALVEHPDVDKIAFTGSTEVGRILRRATAGTGKGLTLELGGKSPFIVFDDADLDSAVEGLVDAIWFNQGQVCCAGSRLLVQESIAEPLLARVRERMAKLEIGDSLEKGIDIGAVVDPVQLERIRELVALGEEEGATVWQPACELPEGGSFFPPTLLTDVQPSATLAQEEIFGPVLVSMTFRTPSEAISLANNSRYGLAASVWTENVNLALDVAPALKAGTVWVNCTNQFDAASGFGGYRESGFGREGGKEGLYAYLKPAWRSGLAKEPRYPGIESAPADEQATADSLASIDRTAKLYIGGRQQRPDGGYSIVQFDAAGFPAGEVPEGNRKDLRNAVEAAVNAPGWTRTTAHNRAQVLFYIAENLAARGEDFARRIAALSGQTAEGASAEVDLCVRRIFSAAAMADKWDGRVHATPMRNVTLAMNEPLGVLGIVAPEEAGFIGFISTVMPALALGNRVVVVPSLRYALLATDFYQVLDTSDLPAGALNIVTGRQEELLPHLAGHMGLEGLWYWGGGDGSRLVEELAAETMKRTWVSHGRYHDWFDAAQGEGEEFYRRATEVKNIWVPYGE